MDAAWMSLTEDFLTSSLVFGIWNCNSGCLDYVSLGKCASSLLSIGYSLDSFLPPLNVASPSAVFWCSILLSFKPFYEQHLGHGFSLNLFIFMAASLRQETETPTSPYSARSLLYPGFASSWHGAINHGFKDTEFVFIPCAKLETGKFHIALGTLLVSYHRQAGLKPKIHRF